MDDLVVTSHVGRDLMQASEHFKTDRAVVWEYVANGLQYTRPGVPPKVVVAVDEKRRVIEISDNGRGMRYSDFEHFFTMHAENLDRLQGRIGRGRFGTGKSAAFGIGDVLEVTSARDGKRTSVRLTRAHISAMRSGDPIPVKVLEGDEDTDAPPGTVVKISEIRLPRIDRLGIIRYIERHLAQLPADVSVYVDHHECRFKAPEVAEEYEFTAAGEDALLLGEGTLRLRVAKGPLPDELRGVSVFSHANWHQTTLAGSEGKPMAEYIFGDVEIPALEEYEGPIPAFDNTRSGELNPNNETVAALYRFIGPRIDSLRRDLVAREREKARSAEAKKLAEQAARISQILTNDFDAFRARLRAVKSALVGRDVGKKFELIGDEDDGPWVLEGNEPATPVDNDPSEPSGQARGGDDQDRPEFLKPAIPDDQGDAAGGPHGGAGAGRRAPRGGLSIEYRNLGDEETRGTYSSDTRTITINLDHPQVAAAYDIGGPEAPVFLRLTAEIAASEYAVALAQELVDTYSMADEAIFDIHETVDRVSRNFVELYREG